MDPREYRSVWWGSGKGHDLGPERVSGSSNNRKTLTELDLEVLDLSEHNWSHTMAETMGFSEEL